MLDHDFFFFLSPVVRGLDSIWRQAGLNLSSFNSPARSTVPTALQEETGKWAGTE